jgi:hypothetical protein
MTTDRPTVCAHIWTDGWGEHTCSREDTHDGPHRCRCDMTAAIPAVRPAAE